MNLDLISKSMNSAVSSGVFSGAVLLCAIKDQIVFHQPFGLADKFEKRPIQKNSVFDLASLTKPLATAIAISKLLEDDSKLLDRELGSILIDFSSTDKAQITIDMLLRHTSGLPAYKEYYKQIIKSDRNPKTFLRQLLVSEPLESEIGMSQGYSDLGFMILSWIIEELSGKSIDVYTYEKIYSPLGIENLFYIPLKNKEKVIGKKQSFIVSTQDCPWRKKVLNAEVDDDNAWAVGGVEGHAGLFGDAFSIYLLCREILNSLTNRPTTLLNSKIINKMVQRKGNHDMVAGFDTPSRKNSSAGKYFSPRSIGHLGFTGTSFWIDPETSLIVILLTNRVHPKRDNDKLRKFRPEIHDLIYEHLI